MARGKYEYWKSDDGLLLLKGWARDGLTDEQLAKKMGISPSTLYAWKDKYSEILEALKKGKEIVDIEVENALLKRALGYEYMEESVEVVTNGKRTERRVKQITKVVPPDVTAQIYWLKNRNPDKWRDKPELPEDPDTLKKVKDLLEGIDSAID